MKTRIPYYEESNNPNKECGTDITCKSELNYARPF